MTAFPWLKLWNEAPDDPKWLTVAEMAGSSRPVVWYTFSKALTYANQNERRGSITGLQREFIASWCQVPLAEVHRIFQAFRELGLLIGDQIAKWTKRQLEKLAKPRSAGAERQARHRAKVAVAAAQGNLELGVTPVSESREALLQTVTSAAEEEEESYSEAIASEREPAFAEVVQIKNHQEKNVERIPRRSRIAADWRPDDRDRQYAATKGYNHEWVERNIERFRDHHLKTGSLFANWHATWRTWVQHEDDFASRTERVRSGSNRQGPGSILAAISRIDAYRAPA